MIKIDYSFKKIKLVVKNNNNGILSKPNQIEEEIKNMEKLIKQHRKQINREGKKIWNG